MLNENSWIDGAMDALSCGAISSTPEKARSSAPRNPISRKASTTSPEKATGRTPSREPDRRAKAVAPEKATFSPPSETHSVQAEADGQLASVSNDQRDSAIGTIIELHRLRWDMIRARQRLELQAQASLRRINDGDKALAGKAWAAVKKAPESAAPWEAAYVQAMTPLLAVQADAERKLAKLVKALPIYPWAKAVSGLGDVSLSAIIGEAGLAPGDYRSVAGLWKRMGLAVIDGGRQRKIAGDAALLHGYSPGRRSVMWNIGACLIKAQVRAVKAEDGTREASIAIGVYGQLYLDRKAIEKERTATAAHAHNRAQRYIEKRLLKNLWRAWRATSSAPEKAIKCAPSEPISRKASEGPPEKANVATPSGEPISQAKGAAPEKAKSAPPAKTDAPSQSKGTP